MKISKENLKKMKEKSQRSKLWDFKNEIEMLRNENVPFHLIREWLIENQVTTSVQNIRQFYLRNLESKTGSNESVNKESSKPEIGMFDNLKRKRNE